MISGNGTIITIPGDNQRTLQEQSGLVLDKLSEFFTVSAGLVFKIFFFKQNLLCCQHLCRNFIGFPATVDNSKISKIEKGRVNIKFNTLVQLAEALEVKVSKLANRYRSV